MNGKNLVVSLFSVVCCCLSLTGCISADTFTLPEIGTRFEKTKDKVAFDGDLNMYVIPLQKYKTLRYDKFDIRIPKDSELEFYAPANSNSSDHGEMYVRNTPPGTEFFARAIYLPVTNERFRSLADIEKFYREKYTPDKYTIGLDTRITTRNGFRVVEYDILARLPDTGKVTAVHGFCMLDPRTPGYMFDFGAGRTAYEKDINHELLIRASGLFLESVRFRK